ncbi:alpha/beta hydrolase [Metabacillus sp. RGM 3146]|uniref:alpha/beta hydrolase n=1 Tax=Metabacillus sp. RGM 3146 TaxID=3401092 RepID=UPI003B9DBC82
MNNQVMEENVTIQGEFKLAGTIARPAIQKRSIPAILILPGTGDSDRDGNGSKLNMNIYRDLAQALARMGYAVLRFDKRGSHESEGDKYKRGLGDLIDDGAACVKFLKGLSYVNEEKIFILGHSEGTMLAPAVHLREQSAGFILLAGGAISMNDVTEWQRENAYKALAELKGFNGWLIKTFNLVDKAKKKNEKFIAKMMESDADVMRVAGKKFPAKWMREHFQYIVEEDYAKLDCPILVIGGTKDSQVPESALRKVKELSKGETEIHIILNMTHILKKLDGEMDQLNPLKTYKQQMQQPIEEEMLQYIENWISKQLILEAV